MFAAVITIFCRHLDKKIVQFIKLTDRGLPDSTSHNQLSFCRNINSSQNYFTKILTIKKSANTAITFR